MTKALILLMISIVVLCPKSAPAQLQLVKRTLVGSGNKQHEKGSNSADRITTIRATVVAYDLGVEQFDGSCKQMVIARRGESAKRNESDRYFIIRHQNSCRQLIPEERLNVEGQRSIKLKRDPKCDQTLGELKYFVTLSPTGLITKRPRLKSPEGWKKIRVSAAKKLPCYFLTSSEVFEK